MDTPVILCLTADALGLAERLAPALGADIHGLEGRVAAPETFTDAMAHIAALFEAGRPIIGICAAGILIRAVAPLLKDKHAEPPVIALSPDGGHAVPLLGGHRGANALAAAAAAALGRGAAAAITTASDGALKLALDAPPPGWRLVGGSDAQNRALMAKATADLLAGANATLSGAAPEWLRAPLEAALGARLTVEATSAATTRLAVAGAARGLAYAPARVAVGVGAERGVDAAEVADLVAAAFAAVDLPVEAAAGVFSIDLKADEAAIHALADQLAAPARFFDAATLAAEEPRLATPSEAVRAEVGVAGVAEAAALAAVGPRGRLLLPKRKSERATVALALAPEPITAAPGRARGRLDIVGLGPGDPAQRTPFAQDCVRLADEVVGYHFYIAMLPQASQAKQRRQFELGEEEARCRYALERAGEGARVALICSGDGGIYAMGALVMELLDRPEAEGGVSAAAKRVQVESAPGVSAMQAASAKAGALLGHDFCAISLSDLLTPWEAIERRIRAAAQGDFVIAFYNPVSQRRRTQLGAARDILAEHRPADTPVLLATDLGRPGERLRRRTLATLSVDEVDMLTVVLVGSSASRAFQTGDAAAGAEGFRLYTPRGYAKKIDAS